MRNYSEYDIVIDPNQDISLDTLDQRLPDLGSADLPPLELFKNCALTECGLVSKGLLEQDFVIGLNQDTPMLDNFYEDETVRQQRRAREKANLAQRKQKREPLHLEPRRPRKKSIESGYGSASEKSTDKPAMKRDVSVSSSMLEEARQERDQEEADARFDEACKDAVERQNEADKDNQLKQAEGDARWREQEEKERKQEETERRRRQEEQQRNSQNEPGRMQRESENQKATEEQERNQERGHEGEEENEGDLKPTEKAAARKMGRLRAIKPSKEEQHTQHSEEQLKATDETDLKVREESERKAKEEEDRQREQQAQNQAANDGKQSPPEGSQNIMQSCQNFSFTRKHMFSAECRTNDGRYIRDHLNMNTLINFDGQQLRWGHGGGFLRYARRAWLHGTSLWAECRVGRSWTMLSLNDLQEHIVNKNGRLDFSLDPIRWD